VLQLDIAGDARGGDLRRILGGLALVEKDQDEAGFASTGKFHDSFGGLPE
jgi:hypothetical protein